MPWLQLRINTSRDEAKLIDDALVKSGALSVTLEDNADQPIFEPELGETPLWHETRVTGLFNADSDTRKILDDICLATKVNSEQTHWHILEDKDWEREWMTHYHPIQIHTDFWICPSWCDKPDPSAINLMLDPGLAFGTGTHPTTFLCLQWIAQQNLTDKTVIDFGCGSGILGIAALLKGAQSVAGTDIDPQALLATKDNVIRNGLDAEQFPVFFPERCPDTRVDFMLANILAGPLVELAPTLAKLVAPHGQICLSGILENQQQPLVDAYQEFFDIDQITEQAGWICLTGKRKQA